MTFDPFAADNADEAQTEIETQEPAVTETPKATPKKAAAKVIAQTETQGGRVTVTLKGGVGFNSPWIVLYGDSAAEVEAQMDPALASLAKKTAQVSKFFQDQVGPGAAAAPAAAQPGRPANASSAPSGEGKECSHGPMTFRSGVSAKNGKAWKGFFCPTPKDTPGQCAAEFIR